MNLLDLASQATSSFASTTGFAFGSTTVYTQQLIQLWTLLPVEILYWDGHIFAAGAMIAAVVGFSLVLLWFFFHW